MIRADINLSDVFNVEKDKRVWVYKHSSEIASCIKDGLPFSDIIKLSDDELKSRVQEISQKNKTDESLEPPKVGF